MIVIEFQKPGEYMLEDTQEGYIKVGDRIYGPARYDQKSNSWTVMNTDINISNLEIEGFSSAIYGVG